MLELEEQRVGRNKDTIVNSAYLNSGEYKRKFDLISNNKELSRVLYRVAKNMLEHRSGTRYEAFTRNLQMIHFGMGINKDR